jgi:predicted Fe-Mo cluster-binding NifX family protein
MKIAIPVDKDKETIFKRTGRAPYFAIYDNGDLEKVIVNAHAASHEHAHHHEENSEEEVRHHRQDILELEGCDIILAQAVGENMQKALQSLGITVEKISRADGTEADEVMDKFLKNSLKRQKEKDVK